MRHRNRRFLCCCFLFLWVHSHFLLVSCEDSRQFINDYSPNSNANNGRGIFSPRMDYDQWKPLGRGDPLKNDPTYDYVPPVLDRVHYWIDPVQRKPDPQDDDNSQKTEVLLLGVSSKKPSTSPSLPVSSDRKDNYDSFLKFVDGPKFTNQNQNQRIARPHFHHQIQQTAQNFYNLAKNKFSNSIQQQRMPYTMLMPPPKSPNVEVIKSSSPLMVTTTPRVPQKDLVTVQTADLVYHSSSLSDANEWKLTTETVPAITTPKIKFNIFPTHLQPPESYIQIQFAPTNVTETRIASNSDHNINYVTPPPLLGVTSKSDDNNNEVMHKGQVSDDVFNTYVKIGKTEAQVHSTVLDESDDDGMMVYSHIKHPTPGPLTLQTLKTMQTMQPPLATNPLVQALVKERTTLTTTTTTEKEEVSTTTPSTMTTDPLFKHYKQPSEPLKGPLYLIIQGHSKVKTYGPGKQFHGIRLQTPALTQDTNEINGDDLGINGRDGYDSGQRRGRSRTDLQTLKHVIQTGLGAINLGDLQRRADDFKETELHFGYEVVDDVPVEEYRRGIVEEARNRKVDGPISISV